MERDMDLVRDLLLWVAAGKQFDGHHFIEATKPEDFGAAGHSLDEVHYHLAMLIKEGFLKGAYTVGGVAISQLTWKGHELLDDIRDPDIWSKTKERAKGLTSVGIGLAWEIAKAEIRKKLGLP